MARWIELIELTNFLFYPIKIRLEVAEIQVQVIHGRIEEEWVQDCIMYYLKW